MLGKTSENAEFLTLIVFGDIDVQIWPKISRTVKKNPSESQYTSSNLAITFLCKSEMVKQKAGAVSTLLQCFRLTEGFQGNFLEQPDNNKLICPT